MEKNKIDNKEVNNDKIVCLRTIAQHERAIGMMQRDLELRRKIYDFEKNNSEIVGDKPKYMLEKEYIDIIMDQRKLILEKNEIELLDGIERSNMTIKDLKLKFKQLERNIKVIDDGRKPE